MHDVDVRPVKRPALRSSGSQPRLFQGAAHLIQPPSYVVRLDFNS